MELVILGSSRPLCSIVEHLICAQIFACEDQIENVFESHCIRMWRVKGNFGLITSLISPKPGAQIRIPVQVATTATYHSMAANYSGQAIHSDWNWHRDRDCYCDRDWDWKNASSRFRFVLRSDAEVASMVEITLATCSKFPDCRRMCYFHTQCD